ncbi:hypothetical protein, partial [Morganella morganii]
MGGFVKKLFGGKTASERNALRAAGQQAQDNQRIQQITQAQQIQAQGQQAAAADKGLAGARKANRGRRLL